MSQDKCVVILAAGKISALNVGYGNSLCNHPALYAAGSQLAIHCIIDHYKNKHSIHNFIVVIDRPLPNNIPAKGFDEICFQFIRPQGSIIDSLSTTLDEINHEWLIINPITTIPALDSTPNCFINIGSKLLYQENWASLIEPDELNKKWRFEKKDSRSCFLKAYPFTGIIGAKKLDIAKHINSISSHNKNDLVNLAEILYEMLDIRIIKSEWLDIGHYATYAQSKLSKINSRAFNSLHYCQKERSITKTSYDNQRLDSERDYLQNLPFKLKRYFPHVLNKLTVDDHTLKLESISFPSLAELHLHWDIGPNAWYKIIDEIFFISSEMGNSTSKSIGSSGWLYETKLKERYHQFRKDSFMNNPNFTWWENEVCINGKWLESLDKQVEDVCNQLSKLSQNSVLQLIHGDLCFNNILCDPVYTSICLIDPRGEKPNNLNLPKGYGDSRYDFAKFLHSLLGNYDSIVNNMYKVTWPESALMRFDVYCPNSQELCLEIFKEKFIDLRMNFNDLLLLTCSLFFSMLPLHKEDSDRQTALAIMGMILKDMHDHACSYTSSRRRFSF